MWDAYEKEKIKMKINIRPRNCRFIVNEQERKVICILENTRDLVTDFVDINSFDCPFYLTKKEYEELKIPNRFTGIATCAPEDKWNEELGKAIAFSKLKYKVNASMFKRGDKLVEILDKKVNRIIEQFDAYGEKISANEEKRHNWINTHMNEE